MRDALAQTKDFNGVTGTISMDGNRNAVKPAVVLKLMDVSLYQETIQPVASRPRQRLLHRRPRRPADLRLRS